MKTGDKIEFTEQQRTSMLHLFANMVLTEDSANHADERAALAGRVLWGAIHDALGLDETLTYRLLPKFQGVEIAKHSEDMRLCLDTYSVLGEWLELRKKLRAIEGDLSHES